MAASYNFALEAQRRLGGGNATEAVQLLEEGLQSYPEYATAYAVLARAYLQMNDIEAAYQTVKRGRKRFPANRALNILEDDLRPLSFESDSSYVDPLATVTQADSAKSEKRYSESDSSKAYADAGERGSDSLHDSSGGEKTADSLQTSGADHRAGSAQVNSLSTASNNKSDEESGSTSRDDAHASEIESGEQSAAQQSHSNRLQPPDPSTILKSINVIDGNIVLDHSVIERYVPENDTLQLRIIETSRSASSTDRTLRSANLRLIPGLEFTPLRIQSLRRQHVRMNNLPELPQFPVIRGSTMNKSPQLAAAAAKDARRKKSATTHKVRSTEEHRKSPLEELASRLERARIPVVNEESSWAANATAPQRGAELSVVSDTMAEIYERQGAREQAIKAYRQLARIKPEKLEFYEQKIAALLASN